MRKAPALLRALTAVLCWSLELEGVVVLRDVAVILVGIFVIGEEVELAEDLLETHAGLLPKEDVRIDVGLPISVMPPAMLSRIFSEISMPSNLSSAMMIASSRLWLLALRLLIRAAGCVIPVIL